MKGKKALVILTASLFLLLTGCFFKSPDELYAVPKAPEDYQNLQKKIDEVLSAGAEYAAPLAGSYTQTVQLRDLDGDGVQEAVAFFRMSAPPPNQERNEPFKPLKIYIFRQQADNTFAVQTIVEEEASAISAIAYEDLDGDGSKELAVSWSYSNLNYQLAVYALHGSTADEILRESYSDFAILDLDKDNLKEIVLLNLDIVEGASRANFYDYDAERGGMYLAGSAPMSKGISGLSDIRPKVIGNIRGAAPDSYEPALFVTSGVVGEDNRTIGVITDIFARRDGSLVNVTLDAESGKSESTFRLTSGLTSAPIVGLRDINRDTILEFPRPTAFPDPKNPAGSTIFWSIQWVQYDLQGAVAPVFTTYYNGEDGWYLVLPDSWAPLINPGEEGPKITLARRDITGSGERAVVFSLWDGKVTSEPTPFLTIYKLTGPNRLTRSTLGGRFVLLEERDTIYAADLSTRIWDSGLTQESLVQQFSLIQPE